jgi:hypothetical protein
MKIYGKSLLESSKKSPQMALVSIKGFQSRDFNQGISITGAQEGITNALKPQGADQCMVDNKKYFLPRKRMKRRAEGCLTP